jgi:hypothetical protein
MSSVARWSYTAKATHWPLQTAADWKGARAFGSPVEFACDYQAKAQNMTDAAGREFVSRQQIYTEHVGILVGDRVLIGESTAIDPVAAGAWEVKAVTRWGDTFERVSDDYLVAT